MLTSKQRSYLRGLGNKMEPVVQIGKAGVTGSLIVQVVETLEARELIKMKVLNNCMASVREVADQIAAEAGADVVQTIGSKILIYKESEEKPTIELPQ